MLIAFGNTLFQVKKNKYCMLWKACWFLVDSTNFYVPHLVHRGNTRNGSFGGLVKNT